MIDSDVKAKQAENCDARQVVNDYKVDHARLSLIYADDFRELGDNYKRMLRHNINDRSGYKRFCRQHAIFFMEYEGVKRVMPKHRA